VRKSVFEKSYSNEPTEDYSESEELLLLST